MERKVLIAVLGLTPQIITETLYYLTQVKKPPVIPDEVYVITTSRGRERILKSLLGEGGQFVRFCREYGIDPDAIRFGADTVLTLRDAQGRPLEDIRTARDNELAADQIVAFVRDMAEDPDATLYCSAAGGRKTMGIYLAYALTFFGRPQDVLFHVLVDEEFEAHPEFFYKPKEAKTLHVRSPDGSLRLASTEKARIELAEVPFVRLREKLEGLFGPGPASYGEMVALAQRGVDLASVPPEVEVDLSKGELRVGDVEVRLPPVQLAVYTYYLRNKLERCVHPERQDCRGCTDCYEPLEETLSPRGMERIRRDYVRLCGARGVGWGEKLDQANIRSYISKINGALRRATGDLADQLIVARPSRRWNDAAYGVRLDRSRIRLRE